MRPATEMPMLTLSSRVVRAYDPLSVDVGGETVMLDRRLDCYVGLDPVAAAIWRGLAEPTDVAGLCARLEASYDGDPDTIRRDVLDFLRLLIDKGLVRRLD
ncbi:MAG: hypothetical protein OHK0024_08390 [Thalassobaculales bacterium]